MPTSTAQPASGNGISKPVASRMPSWRDGPPRNWMIAPGIAQISKRQRDIGGRAGLDRRDIDAIDRRHQVLRKIAGIGE